MKIDGIYVTVRGDIRQLDDDLKKARGIVKQTATEMSDSLGNALRPESVQRGTNELINSLSRLSNFSKTTGESFKGMGANLGDLTKVTGMTSDAFGSLQSRMLETRATQEAERAFASIAKATGMTAAEMKAFGQSMGLSQEAIGKFTSGMSGASGGATALLASLGPLGSVIAGAFALEKIMSFKDEVIQTKLQFESFERVLKVVTGSQMGADLQMQSLADTSNRLGVRLMDAAGGYKLIASAAKGTTLEGAAAKQVFEAVATATSVLGLNAESTNGTLLALSQMISKGKVQAEELRGQLGERLPGAFQIAARAMNMTTAELDKLMQNGGVAADQFLPKFATELMKTFGSGATDAGNSGQAAFNRLENAWDQLKLAIADTGVWQSVINKLKMMAGAVNALADSVRDASGTFTGIKLIENLERRLEMLKGPESVYAFGSPENYDPAKVAAEIASIEAKLVNARQAIQDTAQEDWGKTQQNATRKAFDDQVKAIKGGEAAVLEAYTQSADKRVALWAKHEKAVREAQEKAAKGDIDQASLKILIDEADRNYKAGLDEMGKGTEKFGERAQAVFDQVKSTITSMEDSLTGGTEKAATRVDSAFTKLAGQIRVSMAEAKGDVGSYREALKLAGITFGEDGSPKPVEGGKWSSLSALGRATDEASVMERRAKQLQEFAQLSGSIEDQIAAKRIEAEAKYIKESKSLEDSISGQAEAKRAAYYAQEAEARAKALGEAGKLTKAYYDVEKMHLDQRITALRAAGVDEVTIARYAAQEKTKLAKTLLDAQVQYTDSFTEYLAGRLSQDYGLYKDELARQRDLWEDFYKGLKSGIDSFENAFVAGLNGRTVEVKRILTDLLTELEKMFVHHVLVIPIVEQVVGVLGGGSSGSGAASSASAAAGGNGKGISGYLSTALGLGSKGYELYTGNSLLGSVGEMLGLGGAVGTGFGAATLGGMSDAAAATAASALMAQVEATGGAVTGAASGGLLGGLASSMGISTGALATGIGALVAIPAIIAMGTQKTVQTQMTGNSGLTINVHGGEVSPFGFSTWKQTESSMFGGESTSHFVMPYVLDPAVAAKVEEAVTAIDKKTVEWAKNLGLSTASLSNANYLLNYTSPNIDQMTVDLKNLFAQTMADASGMGDDLKNLGHAGESVGATMERLSTAITEVSMDAQLAGVNLQQLSGGLSGLKLADYASQLVEAMGSVSAVQSAFNLYATNTLSSGALAQNTLNYLAGQTGTALAAIGNPAVSIDNFWSSYQQAMGGPMTADQFSKWASAATAVDQLNNALKTTAQNAANATVGNSTYAASLQSTVSAMSSVVSSIAAFRYQIMTGAASPLSSGDRLGYALNAYDSALAAARGGDQTAMGQLTSLGQSLLSVNQEVNASTVAYYSIQEHVYDTLGEIQGQAQSAYDVAVNQLGALNQQIQIGGQTLDAINAANFSITDAINATLGAVRAAQTAAQTGSTSTGGGSTGTTPTTSTTTTGTTGTYSGPVTVDPSDVFQGYGSADNLFAAVSNPGSIFWGQPEPGFAIGAAASGGLRGGWTLVGEEGPELVNFTRPGRVYTAKETAKALREDGGNSDVVSALGEVGLALASRLDAVNSRLAKVEAGLDRANSRPRAQ